MLCPECNAENREEARFCDQCGCALEEVGSAEPAAEAKHARESEAEGLQGLDSASEADGSDAIDSSEGEPGAADDADDSVGADHDASGDGPDSPGDAQAVVSDAESSDEQVATAVSDDEAEIVQGEEDEALDSSLALDATERLEDAEAAVTDDAKSASGDSDDAESGEADEGDSGQNVDSAAVTELIATKPANAAASALTEVLSAEHSGASDGSSLDSDAEGAPEASSHIDFSGFDTPLFDYGPAELDHDDVRDGLPAHAGEPNASRDGDTLEMNPVEADGEEGGARKFIDSDRPDRPVHRRLPKFALAGVCVAAVLACVVAFATYQLELWGGKVVPDVVGMKEADAKAVLVDHGFEARTLQVMSDDTAGTVLVMDPEANSRIGAGEEVYVHVATPRVIPEIVGLPKDDALAKLGESGFTNVETTYERSNEEEGTVLAVDPAAGSGVMSSEKITVVVSEAYIVPDIVGMAFEDAVAAIADAGLYYQTKIVETEDYQDGAIFGTEPAAGTKVEGDYTVTILIAHARGPELEELTRQYLEDNSRMRIGMSSYEIDSIDSVEYEGDGKVKFTVTARPYAELFGGDSYFPQRQVNGTVTWTADNTIESIR